MESEYHQQIKDGLEELMLLIKPKEIQYPPTLDEDGKRFIIQYSGPNGVSHMLEFLGKMKDGNFLTGDDIKKIKDTLKSGEVVCNVYGEHEFGFTKNSNGSATLHFTPYGDPQVIIDDLQKSIASAHKTNMDDIAASKKDITVANRDNKDALPAPIDDIAVKGFLKAFKEKLADGMTLGIVQLNATGSINAEFSREDAAAPQMHEFFDRIKAAGFLRNEDMPKLRAANMNGHTHIQNDQCSMDVKSEGNIININFMPHLSKMTLTTLDQAIKKMDEHKAAYNSHKKSLDKYLPHDFDGIMDIPSDPGENFAAKHLSRHLPSDAAFVANHVVNTAQKQFPGANVKVDFSPSPQKAEPEFFVRIGRTGNKPVEFIGFLKQLKSEWNSANIERLHDIGDEINFRISASPSLLKALINKPDRKAHDEPQAVMTR